MRKKSQGRSVLMPKKDFFVKFVKIFTIAGRPGPILGVSWGDMRPTFARKKSPYAGADRITDRTRALRRASALARCSASALKKFSEKKFVNFFTITGKSKFSQKFHKKHLTFWLMCAILKTGWFAQKRPANYTTSVTPVKHFF